MYVCMCVCVCVYVCVYACVRRVLIPERRVISLAKKKKKKKVKWKKRKKKTQGECSFPRKTFAVIFYPSLFFFLFTGASESASFRGLARSLCD